MSIWIVVILFVNFGISWLNAWGVGRSWADSKVIKGWPRIVVWSAAVMSASGFTWCYLIPVTLIFGYFKWLPPDMVNFTLELGYVLIIFPVLGSGLAIWIDSVTTAWRRRDIASMGIAGWNTFAMTHNTYHAVKLLPGVFKHIGEVFKSRGDGRAKLVIFGVTLVILASIAGVLTTRAIIMSTARKYGEEFQKTRPGTEVKEIK